MSHQTGRDLPPPLTSKRLVDRVRHRAALVLRDPNPIWIRELKQSTRLTRTPIILMVVALLMTLVIASIGGTMSNQEPADKIGVTLFHTYFSIAFFVVTLVGPALAANAVASEREGKTWDALILTRLAPELIARGKFLAAFTAISTYVVTLAPVGALSFLFGGVTATEVAIAFVALFLLAAVFVSFGLAISAKLQTLRGSIVVTLLLAVPLSASLYLVFGLGAAEGIHSVWPSVPSKLPVWLPTAYVRGEWGVSYVLFLVLMPLVAFVVSTWFCYASTVGNLRDESDDRGLALKQWYLGSLPLVAGTAVYAELAVPATDAEPVAVLAATAMALFLGFVAVVFTAEPTGPSRRVRIAEERSKHGRVRRLLGPSVANTGFVQLAASAVAFLAVAIVGWRCLLHGGARAARDVDGFGYLVAYGLAFLVFAIGLSVWLRARSTSATIARVLLLTTLAAAAILPWVLAAILGVLARNEDAILIASPSPFYAAVMYQAATDARQSDKVLAGLVCIAGWAGFGLLCLVAGARRCRAADAASREASRATEAMLLEEDRERDAGADASASLA